MTDEGPQSGELGRRTLLGIAACESEHLGTFEQHGAWRGDVGKAPANAGSSVVHEGAGE